jgi:phosphatidylserine synthase
MQTFLDTLVLTCFICCGIARLARYNATVAILPQDQSGKVKFFEGTPIPTSLALVAILAYLSHIGQVDAQLPGGLIEIIPGYSFHAMVIMFGISGTLMVRYVARRGTHLNRHFSALPSIFECELIFPFSLLASYVLANPSRSPSSSSRFPLPTWRERLHITNKVFKSNSAKDS